jgi:hypothetical protein
MPTIRKRNAQQAFWSSYAADPKRNVPHVLAQLTAADEVVTGPEEARRVLDFLRHLGFRDVDVGDGNVWMPVEILSSGGAAPELARPGETEALGIDRSARDRRVHLRMRH